MGVLKTFAYAIILSSAVTSTTRASDDLLDHVTKCIGRMSAQIEHQWLFIESTTDEIEIQRDHLEDILDALVTTENASPALAARIDAKAAHASLLTQAAFSEDKKQSNWAKARAEQQLDLCSDILLPTPSFSPVLAASDTNETSQAQNQETWQASQ